MTMRLIDADELISRLEHWKNLENGRRAGLVQNAINHVIITTTIDLVRCGECVHLLPDGRCTEFADDAIQPSASDFCSYGERRSDERTN